MEELEPLRKKQKIQNKKTKIQYKGSALDADDVLEDTQKQKIKEIVRKSFKKVRYILSWVRCRSYEVP
jgi:hypothetical protein